MGVHHLHLQQLNMYCLGPDVPSSLLPRLTPLSGGVALTCYRPSGGFDQRHIGEVLAAPFGTYNLTPLAVTEPDASPHVRVSGHDTLLCLTVAAGDILDVTIEDLTSPNPTAEAQRPTEAWFGSGEHPMVVDFYGRWLVSQGEYALTVSDRGAPVLSVPLCRPLAGSDELLVTEKQGRVTIWRPDARGYLRKAHQVGPPDSMDDVQWFVGGAHAVGTQVVVLWHCTAAAVVQVVGIDTDGTWWAARTESQHPNLMLSSGSTPALLVNGREIFKVVVGDRDVSLRPLTTANGIGLRLVLDAILDGDDLVAVGQAQYDDVHDVAAISFNSLVEAAPGPTTRTPSGPQPGHVIRSFEDAEEAAAIHLRWLGFTAAAVTPAGRDGGVDVTASGLVAQVKAQMSQVGRPVVQQTLGEATRRRCRAVVYALAGFTTDAVSYADDVNVALFTFDLQGAASPVNGAARQLCP